MPREPGYLASQLVLSLHRPKTKWMATTGRTGDTHLYTHTTRYLARPRRGRDTFSSPEPVPSPYEPIMLTFHDSQVNKAGNKKHFGIKQICLHQAKHHHIYDTKGGCTCSHSRLPLALWCRKCGGVLLGVSKSDLYQNAFHFLLC